MKTNMIGRLLLLSLLLFIVGCAQPAAQPADYVFLNGKVYTVNKKQPWAEAVAVKGNKIAFVGSSDDAKAYIGDKTKVTDLKGKMLMPGFVSIHEHPMATLVFMSGLVMEPQPDAEAMIAEVKKYAEAHPEKKALFSFGGADIGYVEITKEMLDAAVPDRPLLMSAESGHGGWANSKALELIGVTKDAPDPVHFFGRHADGSPTGYIGSSPATFYSLIALDIVDKEELLGVYKELFEGFTEFGITALYDAGVPPGLEGVVYEAVAEVETQGNLPFRIVASCKLQRADQVAQVLDCLNEMGPKYRSDLFTVNTLKVHGDGTMEGRTAGLIEAYADDPKNRGYVAVTGKKFQDLAVAAAKDGFHVHVHAIGDRTAREALDAFEAVRKAGFKTTRLTTGHTQLVDDEDMSRFKELDVIVNTTMFWHRPSPWLIERLGEERYRKMYRYQSLVDQGVRVTFGTDFPATAGGFAALNPLWQIPVGIMRGPGKKEILPPANERLTLEIAIRGYTLDAAYKIALEDKVGSIEVGKLADLIVLDQNLFEIDPEEISKTKVVLTMMDGKVWHDVAYGWGDSELVDKAMAIPDLEECHIDSSQERKALEALEAKAGKKR